MKSIYKFSTQKAKKVVSNNKKTIDAFYNKHLRYNVDPMTIILKTHLRVESYLDRILFLLLPKPKKILEKTFTLKVDFIESLNVLPGEAIIKKIRTLNTIRNKFAHNLNKKLTTKDINSLLDDWEHDKKSKNLNQLKFAATNIVSYLQAVQTICGLFPFVWTCTSHKKVFAKDKGYVSPKKRNPSQIKEIVQIMKNLKM
ncbi:MAG: hypothetical protein HQ579_07730 [Candidatus Omnitrophica bacterium]|nr:hypothetical protein [Candidatus Omnitrophota bacterium]